MGCATAGIVFPRENPGPVWVPRRVSTHSAGEPGSGASGSRSTTSTNPRTTSSSTPTSDGSPSTTSTARTRRPAHGASETVFAFHCCGMLQSAANWLAGVTSKA